MHYALIQYGSNLMDCYGTTIHVPPPSHWQMCWPERPWTDEQDALVQRGAPVFVDPQTGGITLGTPGPTAEEVAAQTAAEEAARQAAEDARKAAEAQAAQDRADAIEAERRSIASIRSVADGMKAGKKLVDVLDADHWNAIADGLEKGLNLRIMATGGVPEVAPSQPAG